MQDDVWGLDGRTAIVTGAGAQLSGIGNGRAAAVALARAGARVVVVDVEQERLDPTVEMIYEEGGDCLAVVADVAVEDDCRRAVAAAADWADGVDVLVNNVGVIGPLETVVDVDLDAWDACFAVNVKSMVLMSRFAIPHMRRQGSGAIVNVSSMAGVISHPRPAYAASKGAVISLTKSMAMVHGPEGIRVNAIAPGMVYTPNVQVEGMDDEVRRARAAAAPLRVEGTGWDIADAVLYLAGARARWTSGVCLNVDGGFSADLRLGQDLTVSRRDTDR